ncbi:hypothetical protein AALO_G00221920 [Alosa alosa]|uniref:Uncharacterized protein n=1 Tax=Alosa alosa TaxID=278164 RepID=A0AAV6G1E8_9TELE|nr:hypothetical protein AALO_G00221920 [Alosa alosa]
MDGKKGNRVSSMHWTGEKGFLTRKGRHAYSRALRAEHTTSTVHPNDGDLDRLSHGQFGSFGTRGQVRDGQQNSGHFNSDTHACNGIQSRGCATAQDCSGCLGLYTCSLSQRKCRLKGLSRHAGRFYKTLRIA